MFEGLSPDEKETVWMRYMEHWDAARVKNADNVPEKPKLERRLANCLEALCQSTDEGIAEYWRIVDRNNRNAPRGMLPSVEPVVNQSLSSGKPINNPINQLTNKESNNLSNHPTIAEVEAYCKEKGLNADVRGFMETMERQGWRDRDGRMVENWKTFLGKWDKRGKTVSAQRYGQREYTEEELDAVSPDLIEEARAQRGTA